jgi:outer membrane protein assembly factor BamB
MNTPARLISATLLFAFSAAPAVAGWNQWRGPNRDGSCPGGKWPAKLSGLQQLWRVPMGASYSGPVTHGNLVFTTESKDKQFEFAHAVDADTGKIVWTAQWEGHQGVPFFARRNGDWIRATPAVDETNVYVSGMQDVLVALDVKTGKVNWRIDFPKDLKANPQSFGYVTSPMVEGGALYTHAGAGFCKLDAATGKVIWRSLDDGGGMMGGSFSSPVIATVAGKRQVIVQGRTELHGLDPENGTGLWSQPVKAFRGMNIYTPVVKGNRIFTSAYGGLSQAWDIGKEGEGLKPSLSWEHKAEGYMSTPVVIGGKVFMHLRNQKAACMDLATGKQEWVSEQKFGEYWSLAYQGDRILALDMKGILYLIKASPEKLEIIDEKKVASEECWAHLAIDGDRIYIRELNALTAFKWTE